MPFDIWGVIAIGIMLLIALGGWGHPPNRT
jgi:hypothetical protein